MCSLSLFCHCDCIEITSVPVVNKLCNVNCVPVVQMVCPTVNVTDVCVGGADVLKHVLSGNGTWLPTNIVSVSLVWL